MPAKNSFNTLAQSGTAKNDSAPYLSDKTVYGLGSDLSDKQAWRDRAKRKLVSQKLAGAMLKVVDMKGEPERKQAIWNTWHCQNNLVSRGGRVYGKYCKNRFCTLCCSIRKAEIINKYLPVLSTWEDPHFVTLTAKSVPEGKLKFMLYAIQRAFRQIREKYKKQHQRGTGEKLMGIKSLECNFNPRAKTYNPHLHVIVPNAEIAKILVAEWLKKWTRRFTNPDAQDVRKVRSIERDLVELIKYGSKVFTEPGKKARGKILPPKVYAAAYDTIFCALKPYRIFERFGFNLPKKVKTAKQPEYLHHYTEFVFNQSFNDWYNPTTGGLLTGYHPAPMLRHLLGDMDTDLR